MNNKTYRDRIVMMLKAVSKELQERAEEVVPEMDMMTDFDIDIRFENDCGCPRVEIDLNSTHYSREVQELVLRGFEEDE